ncbi:HAD family hydrolase [Nonomuraea soli]|uniref:Putative hydrolase of the HAD superfamily n=1 Tax=Nonomuraea soli TaxID=1032476 RepID=A0A7W0CST9_9ACTN|nr:HAD family phosphatase [Nonomuraea soli]MBA2896534.1 putative hydrolase of the HAD superfamily [Nonomuraea soli]
MTFAHGAVLCDFDGVLRHFDGQAQAAIESRYGLAPGELLKAAFDPAIMTPACLGRITAEEWVERLAAVVGERAAEEFSRVPSWIDEEVKAILASVQQHVPVILVTNAMTSLERHLDELGLTYFADDVVSSARVGVAKPDPRILLIAAERAGVPAERCLFVDDRLENVEAAMALGMTAVHFTSAADLQRHVEEATLQGDRAAEDV